MKKLFRILVYLSLFIAAALLFIRLKYHKEEPEGIASPEVDTMTQQIADALGKTAWDSTDWVQWNFRGKRDYLWDKKRGLVQVRLGENQVLLDLNTLQGPVVKNGQLLQDPEAAKIRRKAYAWFCNDSYWLTAPFKINDPGTERSLVQMPNGKKGLKVKYNSGGVTPGDAYVWTLDENGVPLYFNMWVSILPIGGVKATWENWSPLPTGAKISTRHLVGGILNSEIQGLNAGRGAAKFDL